MKTIKNNELQLIHGGISYKMMYGKGVVCGFAVYGLVRFCMDFPNVAGTAIRIFADAILTIADESDKEKKKQEKDKAAFQSYQYTGYTNPAPSAPSYEDVYGIKPNDYNAQYNNAYV